MTITELQSKSDVELSRLLLERGGWAVYSGVAGGTGKTRYCINSDSGPKTIWCDSEAEAWDGTNIPITF